MILQFLKYDALNKHRGFQDDPEFWTDILYPMV